ncbi:integrator complex subunit 14 [Hydra vulgaris]|uniref:Integrator complex subunit 14 n=1 Tax=Hydra vulgaris TaxID=6087 RepID=A0ABM4DE75_HYDVU
MPTVILLDVSLSMSRSINTRDKISLIDIAQSNLLYFFDQLSSRCKLEHSSLVVFSSLYEVLVKFTRDYEALKTACLSITTYDKTKIETALFGIEDLVTEEWGSFVPINLIFITDGQCGIGECSLQESLKTINQKQKDVHFPIPFSFPCNLSIICLASHNELRATKKYFEQLITMNYEKGELIIPDSLTESNVQKCFNRLLSLHYNKYEGTLKCGHFESQVTLSPPPSFQNTFTQIVNLYRHPDDEAPIANLKLGAVLNIIGFLDLQSFSNPAYMSRHLVVPIQNENNQNNAGKNKDSISFQPSFSVLLHGSLKMEKMGAVVKLGNEWYGMLYSWADNKKKSNLMLSIFEPGLERVPWLGNLKYLGPAYELPSNPYLQDAKEGTEESPFPVITSTRRSYHSHTNAVWIKSSGLVSDIQKLLRYAKKLPDKQSVFFKEVNKLRKAGVAYGFHGLLVSLALTLEQEAENMKPEIQVQLRHVAEGLRNASNREMNKNIVAINMFRKKSN